MSYEAFGKHRSGDWRAATSASLILPTFTNRGYTGHEHVDEIGLIHMNGRVYDPELGRFLSADPNIQAPHNSQSYNRYAYLMNNPLKYTDPSGYFWKKIKRAVRKAVKGFRYITGMEAGSRFIKRHAWAQTLIQIGAAMVNPALAGLVSVGLARMNGVGWNDALKGGALTALSGYAAMGIGVLDIGSLGLSSLAHGIAQGGVAELGGGEFRSGFWSGAIGHAVSGPMQSDGNGLMSLSNRSAQGVMLRTTVAAVAGGTVSVLGGGKFANGAKTAAFVHLFNSEVSAAAEYAARKASLKLLEKLTPNELQTLRALAVRGIGEGVKGLRAGQAVFDLLEATYMNGINDITAYRLMSMSPTGRGYYTDKIMAWGKVDWRLFDNGGSSMDVMNNFLGNGR